MIYNQRLEKPRRCQKRKLLKSFSFSDTFDLIDSFSLQLYDIIKPIELAFSGYTFQYYKMSDSEGKSFSASVQDDYSLYHRAKKLGWNNKTSAQFEEIMFVSLEDTHIATVTLHKNGVVALKIDGLKQYDNDRSILRREWLSQVLRTYHLSKGKITRIHFSLDRIGTHITEPLLRFKDGITYLKHLKNKLDVQITRYELTLNKLRTPFNNGFDLLLKLNKSYDRNILS